MTYLLIVISYILGSIPSALIIGKIISGKDIRKLGSGNLGATNTTRVLGKKAGLLVYCLDFLKGYMSLFISNKILGDVDFLVLFGVAAMLGHIFPIFANFRGGKAVATGSAVFAYLYPNILIWLVIVFLIVLLLTGYVSLASISTSVVSSIYIFFLQNNPYRYSLIIMAFVVVFLHRKNIKRILDGTESVSKLKIFKK